MSISQLKRPWFTSCKCSSENYNSHDSHFSSSFNYNSHDSHLIHVHLKITTAMILVLRMSIWQLQQPWFTSYPCTSENYKRHDSHLTHVILQLQKTWFSSYPCHLTVTKDMILILPMSSCNYKRHDSHHTHVILQLHKRYRLPLVGTGS